MYLSVNLFVFTIFLLIFNLARNDINFLESRRKIYPLLDDLRYMSNEQRYNPKVPYNCVSAKQSIVKPVFIQKLNRMIIKL